MTRPKTKPVTIRFYAGQLEKLRKEADRTHLHLQDVVRLCIEAGLDSWPSVLAAKQAKEA